MKNVSLYNATVSTYEAECAEARAMLDMLFNDSVMVGDHTNLLKEIQKWTSKLSSAEISLHTLESNFYEEYEEEEEEENEETEDV